MANEKDIFRGAALPKRAQELLGLLQNLPGKWEGHGFNMIARPARQGVKTNPAFFLEINATSETLEFNTIGGDIPNRGTVEETKLLHGVRYLQTITDCEDGSGIHVEPGLWVHVPETAENPTDTYVRHATIPHGNALLAQSTFATTVAGGPTIDPVNTFPFLLTQPIPSLNDVIHTTLGAPYTDPFITTPLPTQCLPPGLDAAQVIKDPTVVLRAQIADQVAKNNIVGTDVIIITTAGLQGNGVINIPFLVPNANVPQMDAIFWIEKVKHPNAADPVFDDPDRVYLQLQYVQRVILDFDNVHWPHVSVATLKKTL